MGSGMSARGVTARARARGFTRLCDARGCGVRVLSVRRNAAQRAREALSQPHEPDAGFLRLLDAPFWRALGLLPRAARALCLDEHGARGIAHGDRTRRAR